MVSEISDETDIQPPADKVWGIYGSPEFCKFLLVHLPNLIQKIEVLEGDGGRRNSSPCHFRSRYRFITPSTSALLSLFSSMKLQQRVVAYGLESKCLTIQPNNNNHTEKFPCHTGLGGASYKEKLVKVDNEKRIKIAQMVEGGYLDLGFTLYRFRLEIVEKDEGSCIVKSSVQYELKEEAAANISLASVQPLVAIAEAVNNYFLNTQPATDNDA